MSSIDFVPSSFGLHWDASPTSDDDMERASLWSAYFHRFFGSVRPIGEAPFEYSPLSHDDCCMTLGELAERGVLERETIERCVSQMLVAGYQPADRCQDWFERLSCAAFDETLLTPFDSRGRGPSAAQREDALERLWWRGRLRYEVRPGTQAVVSESEMVARPLDLEAREEALSATRLAPTQISYDGGAVTVTKELWAQRDLRTVGYRIDPRRWSEISLFITESLRHDVEEPGDAEGAWSGTLREVFQLNWNRLRYSQFKVVLNVDYTESEGEHKADYRLAYEEDGQLLRDEGFVMAEKVAGCPGWTHYKMVKTVKFASAFLNFLVPAAIAMWVEHDTDDFLARERRSDRRKKAREKPKQRQTRRERRA